MKRIVTIVAFLCCLPVLADGIFWVGFSDIHYGTEGDWSWGLGNTTSNVVYFCQTNYAPNFFVVSGDISECTVGAGPTCVTNY